MSFIEPLFTVFLFSIVNSTMADHSKQGSFERRYIKKIVNDSELELSETELSGNGGPALGDATNDVSIYEVAADRGYFL